jgi:branched-chain amino acid transport system substrate-binding protein
MSEFDNGRRDLIKAGSAATVLAALPKLAHAQGATVKIGYVSPQTGPLAPFGEADKYVIEGMQAHFKNGITIGGKKSAIQVLLKDSQSNPNRAGEVANDLILKDKVQLVLTAGTPETANPVSDACELNEVPCISSVVPWQPWFFGRKGDPAKGFNWTYHFFWGLEDVIGNFTNGWKSVTTNKKVGGLFPNDGDGNAWGDKELGFPKPLASMGFTLLDPGRYQNMSQDFSAQIAAFKKDNIEIVTGVMIPPDFATFWSQAAQQGFAPKVVTIGKALLFPSSVEALGDRGDGLTTEVWWTPDYPYASSLTGQSAKDFGAAYVAATGKPWTATLGFSHAIFEVGLDVIKRAADLTDTASIMAAVASTNLNTIVGPINWANGPVKNVTKTPLAGGQWQRVDGKLELKIVNNKQNPQIPVTGDLKLLG